MALEASRPTQLSAAIALLSSLARGCRDRVWQRELLELAAACSIYAKAPRSEDEARILAKARGIVAAATQLGQEAAASAATAVIAALTTSSQPAAAPADPALAASPPSARPTRDAATAPLEPHRPGQRIASGPRPTPAPLPCVGTDRLVARSAPAAAIGTGLPVAGMKATEPLGATDAGVGQPLVLIVDSDAQSRRVMTTYFRAAGFRVVAFDDGSPVLAKIREERPALVVTDLTLPMMPGDVLILALRRSPATATIPILVVTAEPWRLGSEHDVNGVLTKPVSVTAVIEAARRLVSAGTGTDSLQTARF